MAIIPSNTSNIGEIDKAGREALNGIFGSRLIGMSVPIFSANFNYPVDSKSVILTALNGGTVGQVGNLMSVRTSATPNGSASLQTVKNLRYRAGVDAVGLFTASFSIGVANSDQHIGLFDSQDGFFVGYKDTEFGCFVRKGGVDQFIPQSSFNGDKLDGTGASGFAYNSQFMTIFRVNYGYLGVAPCYFQVYGGHEKGWIPFHTYDPTGTLTGTHINKPYLPIKLEVINRGNTSNIVLQSGSIYAGIIDGASTKIDASARQFSYKISKTNVSGSDQPIAFFNNKSIYGGTVNKIADLLLKVGVAVEGVKPIRVDLYILAATPSVGTSWSNIDTADSNMEVSPTGTVDLTGAFLLESWSFGKSSSANIEVSDLNLSLAAGKCAVFVATSVSAFDISFSNRWSELF